MSDYMFMLENHLNAEQSRFMAALQAACDAAGSNVFLTGGAMRDMLGGFPIRDLDFVVEGNAVKMAKEIVAKQGGTIESVDDLRKCVEIVLPGGSQLQVAMARQERYGKPGSKPQIAPSSIHEDLRRRDFSINSIALSIGRASRGLLLDPTNGLADLDRRELRAVSNYGFYDDPSRLWRLIRLKVRLGFAVEERTEMQYRNAREAELDQHIPPRALFEHLRQTASEPNPGDVLKALDEEKLLRRVSPALTGQKLNPQGFARWTKARQLVPFGIEFRVNPFPLFLYLMMERLTAKERAALLKAVAATRGEADQAARLESRAKKLESALKSAKLQKASQVYEALAGEAGETILFLYMRTQQRLVADRIRNYLQKYLPAAAEITGKDIEAEGLKPGTPKFARRKAEKIAARLDARVRKPAPTPEPAPAPAVAGRRAM